ncbi:hypothetical protein CEE39_08000 [bacterium (candidate division B38) B3_B38]|nr:MAG: hypothetical protein CEE39_08000 [bacterium (candidate division B38) B3_B38]
MIISSMEFNMYKTILVPLDGSKGAERILRHVENLAQCFRSRVIFLQVVRLPHIGGVEEYSIELHRREIEQRFKEAESYLKSLKCYDNNNRSFGGFPTGSASARWWHNSDPSSHLRHRNKRQPPSPPPPWR